MDLTTRQDVLDYMAAATNEADWNNRCAEVKAANNGGYPAFWYGEIIVSGVYARCKSLWGRA